MNWKLLEVKKSGITTRGREKGVVLSLQGV